MVDNLWVFGGVRNQRKGFWEWVIRNERRKGKRQAPGDGVYFTWLLYFDTEFDPRPNLICVPSREQTLWRQRHRSFLCPIQDPSPTSAAPRHMWCITRRCIFVLSWISLCPCVQCLESLLHLLDRRKDQSLVVWYARFLMIYNLLLSKERGCVCRFYLRLCVE